ncbi:MAG: hypothetical protein QOC99_4058 [Acidobacteriota bacterium]|jgi:hypothetical protein|nr:hypothetical protein [Acidobacteriota bacterium]
MKELRHFGIYTLADSSFTLIAFDCGAGKYFLYKRARGLDSPPLFVVKDDGRVRFNFGTETEWGTNDLEDTDEDFNPTHHYGDVAGER